MIRPLRDRIIVQMIEPETKTPSGLLLPKDKQNHHQDEGIILAAGPKVVTVKEGDKVIFGQNVGQLIKTDEGEVLAMREDDLIAVID